MTRKPTHGGARPGAGRPRTTGSGSTPPVWYRLSAEQRAAVERLARIRGVAVNALARDALLELIDAVH